MKKILVVFHPLNEAMDYINSGGTQFAPHHFWCFDQLKKTGHQVDFLETSAEPTFWNKLGDKVGINVLQQQLDCLRVAKNYDLIFVPFMEFSFFIAALKVLRLYNKPVVAISQFSYLPSHNNWLKRLKEKLIRQIYFKGVDTMIYYCKPLLDWSNKSSIGAKDIVFVDNWGIDFEFFDSFRQAQEVPPTEDYIYSTGGSYRDFNTLTKAFNSIDFNLKITTVGNLDGYEECVITPNILIDNSLPFGLGSTGIIRKEYYNALAVAVPLLRTSEPENYGITVLMEGMAMGKPVIATDSPGFGFDIQKEKVGLSVDYGDVEGWRQAVQYIIDNPGEAHEMGERGRHLVKNKYNYSLFCKGVNQQILKWLPQGNFTQRSVQQKMQKEYSL